MRMGIRNEFAKDMNADIHDGGLPPLEETTQSGSQRSCCLFFVHIRTGSQAKKRMSGSHASVHDNGQPRRFRYPPGLLRGDPKLEPEDLCADRDGLSGDLGSFLGGPENLHHVYGHIDLSQRAEHMLSEELAPTRVYRQDAIALALQVAWDLVCGLRRISRGTNHRNGPGLCVDAQELLTLSLFHPLKQFALAFARQTRPR